jgi:hypothetical protein
VKNTFVSQIKCALVVALGSAALTAAAHAVTASLPSGAVLAIPSPNLRTVEIALDDVSGIEAALFRVQYNRGVAIAMAVRPTDLTDHCAMEVNTANPTNEVQISMACTSPLSGSGPLFEIDFAGANAGSSSLTFLECLLNEVGVGPACQVANGSLLVTTCALDVDASGAAAANTDGVYIFRALPPTLQNVVPPAFRQLIPGIPADQVVLDNVNAILPLLDVDDRNGAQASTDGVYIFRALPPTLQTIVPTTFRQLDPTIPSDGVIGANIDALCP